MIEFVCTYWGEILAVCLAVGIPGTVAFSCWRDHRRQMKLEAHPERMTDGQYRNFNRERFHK
jgi:hypothetical protein